MKREVIVIVILATLVVGLIGVTLAKQKTVDASLRLRESAMQAYKSGEYTKACDLYRQMNRDGVSTSASSVLEDACSKAR
jgi:pentatricopeptide repeat protein